MSRRRPRARRFTCSVLLIALTVTLTGCWDQREIEERSTILAITIDRMSKAGGQQKGGGGQSAGAETPVGSGRGDGNRITLGVQLAVPGGVPLGNQARGGGGGPPETTVLQTTGRTSMDALSNLRARLNYQTFFGHTRLIAVSEETARQGIFNALNVFRRHPDIRRLLWMVVIEGKASEFLKFKPSLERVPTAFVINMLDDLVRRGRMPNFFFGAFLTRMANLGEDAIAPHLRVDKRDIQFLGMAVFQDDRMVGSINRAETWTFLKITGASRASEEMILSLEGKKVGVRITSRHSTIQPKLVNGKLQMRIKIEVEANIRETLGGFRVSDSRALEKVAGALESRIRKSAQELIDKMQGWETDIFGFGEYVRALQPEAWKPEGWEETFSTLPVQVEVMAELRRTGMLAW